VGFFWRIAMEKELKINWRYQSLHTPDPNELDWVLVQQVEKDICLLYHQLSEYSYIL